MVSSSYLLFACTMSTPSSSCHPVSYIRKSSQLALQHRLLRIHPRLPPCPRLLLPLQHHSLCMSPLLDSPPSSSLFLGSNRYHHNTHLRLGALRRNCHLSFTPVRLCPPLLWPGSITFPSLPLFCPHSLIQDILCNRTTRLSGPRSYVLRKMVRSQGPHDRNHDHRNRSVHPLLLFTLSTHSPIQPIQ